VITVGDEKRARAVALLFDGASLCFDSISPIYNGNSGCITDIGGVYGYRSSRGFLTYTGRYKGQAVSVVSIGMGYPNMDFFVREVRAIVKGTLAVIRIGTCGAISGGGIGMLAIPDKGSLMVQRNYDYPFNLEFAASLEEEPYHISRACLPHKKLTESLIKEACLQLGQERVLRGANASSDSFYSSQGRPSGGFKDANETLVQKLLARGVTSLEMETGQLLHLASCFNDLSGPIWASAIHIVVADRLNNEFLTNLEHRTRLDQCAARVALEALISVELRDSEKM
jgi:uridine phosphorylase